MLEAVAANPTDANDPIVSLLTKATKAKRVAKNYRAMATERRNPGAAPQNVSINTPYGSGTIQIGGGSNLGLGSTTMLSSSDGTQPSFVG